MLLYRLLASGDSILNKLISTLALALAATIAIVLHEISHGYAAKLNGDLTAKARGRLTLNPIAHFDMLGLLLLLVVGFGWAKPVPIDPRNFKDYKKGMITVSIAGVCTNLVLGSIGLLLAYLLSPILTLQTTNLGISLLQVFFLYSIIYGIQINFALALFNILPIYPLDGFNLLNTFLPRGNSYSRFMYRYGMWVLIGIILIGQIASMLNFKYLNIFGLFNELIADLVLKIFSRGIG